jgi:glycosyltransferase involved in cell wall biosynthesis
MRIAQVAPLLEPVPPPLYGGAERVVSWLTEELVSAGHEVVLYASPGSRTSAELVPVGPGPLSPEGWSEALPATLQLVERVMRDARRYDVVHFHLPWVHFPFVRRERLVHLTTVHGPLAPEHGPALEEYRELPLVALSQGQVEAAPAANWIGVVPPGVPLDQHRPRSLPGEHLLFLGRISPEKRIDRAIATALAAGVPLKVAARVPPTDRSYFDRVVVPMLAAAGEMVEFLGEVGGERKDELLGGARALLVPSDAPEASGMAVVEALACGTPVVAWRQSAVAELVLPGETGFVVEDLDRAVAAVRSAAGLDRGACRAWFEARYTAARMAASYVELYERLVGLIPARRVARR